MLSLFSLPSELLASHLYTTWSDLFSGLIHTPETPISTMVSFSYREYLSTPGLASAVHANFTIQPRHASLVVTFAVKLTFSGLTAERQKKKNRSAKNRFLQLHCLLLCVCPTSSN